MRDISLEALFRQPFEAQWRLSTADHLPGSSPLTLKRQPTGTRVGDGLVDLNRYVLQSIVSHWRYSFARFFKTLGESIWRGTFARTRHRAQMKLTVQNTFAATVEA